MTYVLCIYVFICSYVKVYVYVRPCVCVRVRVGMCVCMCMYVRVLIFTHVYTMHIFQSILIAHIKSNIND